MTAKSLLERLLLEFHFRCYDKYPQEPLLQGQSGFPDRGFSRPTGSQMKETEDRIESGGLSGHAKAAKQPEFISEFAYIQKQNRAQQMVSQYLTRKPFLSLR